MLIDTTLDSTSAKNRKRKANTRWHAVAIGSPSNACAAAKACKGKRYLSSEAPRLPLADCDAARCQCTYRHYEDRRGEPRRSEVDPVSRAGAIPERRGRRGRRATD